MKKGYLIGGGIIAAILIWAFSIYNGIISKNNAVNSQWGNVESVYQKRSDLVPNLVNTVKGAANFEQETLTQVIDARSKATSTTINANDLTPENIAQFQQAQDGLTSALNRLMVVVERYPELKATQNFMSLQTELSSIESEIQFERKKFNTSVEEYNNTVLTMPTRLVASLFGYGEKGYFTASAGAENAPSVNF